MANLLDEFRWFPNDGSRWWICWVDRYTFPHLTATTRGVTIGARLIPRQYDELSLERLPTAELLHQTTKRLAGVELVGAIPRLCAGDVFCDGVQIGTLPLETLQTTFQRPRCRSRIREAADVGLPDTMIDPYPLRVSRGEPFHGMAATFSKAAFLELSQADLTVLIPCREIFRTWYAPHQEIALALLAGPWKDELAAVANPERTITLADGVWQVCPRPRLPDRSAERLANLILGRCGRPAANRVYSEILDAKSRGQDGAYLRSDFPFEWDKLSLRMYGIWLSQEPKRFLVFRLGACDWPYPEQTTIVVRDLESGWPERPARPHTPVRPWREPSPNAARVPIHSDADPEAASETTPLDAPPLEWIRPPVTIKAPREPSAHREREWPRDWSHEEADGASPGRRGGRRTRRSQTSYGATRTREACSRFLAVTTLFEQLEKMKAIDGWMVRPPSGDGHFRGAFQVWPFPTKGIKEQKEFAYGAWVRVDPLEGTLRTALVCVVRVAGVDVHWIEIETRHEKECFKALIATFAEETAVAAIKELLVEAAVRKGVWPDSATLRKLTGAAVVRSWTHSHVAREDAKDKDAKDKDAVDKDAPGKALNHRRALAALKSVACPDKT